MNYSPRSHLSGYIQPTLLLFNHNLRVSLALIIIPLYSRAAHALIADARMRRRADDIDAVGRLRVVGHGDQARRDAERFARAQRLVLVLEALQLEAARREGGAQLAQQHHVRPQLVEGVANVLGGRRRRI